MHFNWTFLNSSKLLFGEYVGFSWQAVVDLLTANPLLGYPVLVIVMSVAAFLMYGWDKRQAQSNGWRVPEKRLHTLAFLGGWPGAMFGQSYFRHKTQKSSFKIMTCLLYTSPSPRDQRGSRMPSSA